jgi:Spy/CpxP family protein refolding chaperone
MKKTMLILSLIFLGTANQYAQDKPAKGQISAEEKAKLKEMRKDLQLTDEQKAKLKEVHKERKAGKEARKAMSKEQRKAEHMATKAKVDTILNNEQDAKMSEIRKKRREYRKN